MLSSGLLVVSEGNNILGIHATAGIHETESLHIEHESSVLHEMHAEVILKHKQLLFEGVLSLHSVLVLNSLLPHAHELPSLELLEEGKLLDVVVRISLDEPLAERKELNGSIIFVKGKPLAGESVVLLLVSSLIRSNQEIIRVLIRIRIKINEYSLFLALDVKQELDVLAEVAPFLAVSPLLTFCSGLIFGSSGELHLFFVVSAALA